MNAGYCSGWVSQCCGFDLTAIEITCRARGDPRCFFLMSTPNMIHEKVQQYIAKVDSSIFHS